MRAPLDELLIQGGAEPCGRQQRLSKRGATARSPLAAEGTTWMPTQPKLAVRAPRRDTMWARWRTLMGSMVLLDLMGGVALLLWGLHMVQTGILRTFGSELRHLLSKALGNRGAAFAAGLGLTALLQSSTATALDEGVICRAGARRACSGARHPARFWRSTSRQASSRARLASKFGASLRAEKCRLNSKTDMSCLQGSARATSRPASWLIRIAKSYLSMSRAISRSSG